MEYVHSVDIKLRNSLLPNNNATQNVNYPALKGEASCFKAEACPKGRGLSSTGTKGRSDPDLFNMLREAL